MSISPKPSRDIGELLRIMRALRDPVDGCPWDVAQSFPTIVPYTIEEAYEVAEAIERNDMADLCDELGDLLLQVVFYAQMASEAGSFDFGDVVQAITAKMIRRHPHVFGDEAAGDARAAKRSWEAIKADEKAARAARAPDAEQPPTGLLDQVPRTLPPLIAAGKLQAKASQVGFDWGDAAPVLDKMDEELGELRTVVASEDRAQIEAEMGDVFFSLVNLARLLEIEPEQALRATNAKFRRRFGFIETSLAATGIPLEAVSLDEMEALWVKAKLEEF